MALSARFLAGLVAVAVLTSVSSGAVIITEIMYDPASDDTSPSIGEWVEIYNTGPAAVSVSGWKLDDEDSGLNQDWGTIGTADTLQPGQVAVLFDTLFATPAEFRADWGVPAEALVIAVQWGNLSNTVNDAGAAQELLQLVNSSSVSQDAVNIENGVGNWPTKNGAGSFYLAAGHLTAADNDLGSSWALSAVGVDDARNPIASPAKYNVLDTGSPGQVPVPEPGTLGVLSLAGLMGLRRRR